MAKETSQRTWKILMENTDMANAFVFE